MYYPNLVISNNPLLLQIWESGTGYISYKSAFRKISSTEGGGAIQEWVKKRYRERRKVFKNARHCFGYSGQRTWKTRRTIPTCSARHPMSVEIHRQDI